MNRTSDEPNWIKWMFLFHNWEWHYVNISLCPESIRSIQSASFLFLPLALTAIDVTYFVINLRTTNIVAIGFFKADMIGNYLLFIASMQLKIFN